MKPCIEIFHVTADYINAAEELAAYIDNSNNELEDFKRHIREGNSPASHIYNAAAIVGGWEDAIQEILEEENKRSEWQNACHDEY